MHQGGKQQFASPEEALQHYGVKGMRWGVRKQRPPKDDELSRLKEKPVVRTMKNGDQITLTAGPPNALIRTIGALLPSARKKIENGAFLSIHNKDGKKIGSASFWNEDEDSMHLALIKIEKSERGKGYATEMLKGAQEYGQRTGKKQMTLQVPFDSPDARHIYEKMGFKVTKEAGDDVLTDMVYRFDEV